MASTERLVVLDFIRGVAVLGIFVINIESFAFADAFSPYRSGFNTGLDRDFRFWTYFLFQGKFFGLFALLFGVGFHLFLEKACRSGSRGIDLYAYRMFWLFAIGALHAYLLWPGDILYHYAVCGLLLLPARRLRIRHLAICMFVLGLLIGLKGVSSTGRLIEREAKYEVAMRTAVLERSQAQLDSIDQWAKRHSVQEPEVVDPGSPRLGSYFDNLSANIDAVKLADGQIYYRGILFRTLLLMLAGILLYRLGVFRDYRSLKGYWPITATLLVLGLAMNYSRHWSWTYAYYEPVTSYGLALAHDFSKEVLSIAYLLVLNGTFQKFLRNRSFNPIASAGRMALSNYLLQSLLAGLIFYGYGIGLHGSLGRAELWPLVIIVWLLQLGLSQLWLSRFQQGPVEALWRWLTYRASSPGPVFSRLH